MNVLKIAQKVIKKQNFIYKQYTSRATNDLGQWVTTYKDPPDNISGNIQPINKSLYQELGLEFQKTYVVIHITENLLDVQRNVSGDQVVYNSNTYECLSRLQDWFTQRGFITILAVQID